MTERFIVDDCGTLIDMQTRDTFDYVSDVCSLLNEQHETIQRLQENINELLSVNVEEELEKENKQLKQSNERLLKMLDNVANYMQKQNKYMPIDDFVEWWNGIATKGLDDGDVE